MRMSKKNLSYYFSSVKDFSNLIIAVFFILITGCDTAQNAYDQKNSSNMELQYMTVSEKTRASIQILSNSKILFAHHSVGGDILRGVNELSKEVGSHLIVNGANQSLDDRNMIAHFTPGKNGFPTSKIDGFVEEIKNLNSEFMPQVAFLKLCFVDFEPDTDVNDVFDYYKREISKLERENPDIKFLHLTAPLKIRPSGVKNTIKRLLGKKPWEDASNIKRYEYNDLIIDTYQDSVFDIAKTESTRLDGSRVTFTSDGKTYYSLAPEFTTDGGHLNELGKRVTALQMVDFLADKITAEE